MNRPARADAAEDQAIERKIAPVIECINTVNAPLMRGIEGYRKLVAEIKEEPNATSLAFMGGFEQGDFHFPKALKCADDLTSVAGAPPKLDELDRMASEYATTLRASAGSYLRNVKEMRRALDPESKTPDRCCAPSSSRWSTPTTRWSATTINEAVTDARSLRALFSSPSAP